MKKLYLLFIILCIFHGADASHTFSSHIEVKHLSGYNYKIQLTVLSDVSGIQSPSQTTISVFQKDSALFLNQLTLQQDNYTIFNPNIPGCPSGMNFSVTNYSTNITLSPSTYNSPGGYVFLWTYCCANFGVVNISYQSSTGHSALTVIPPVIDSAGNQIVNHSPTLQQPIIEQAYNLLPYSNDLSGFDIDGDSLVYSLYTPFNHSAGLSQGMSSTVFAPFIDPSSQMPPIQWAPGYSQNDQIHGFPGPNPSPNRLKIDASTGVVTLTPNVSGPSILLCGIVCYEYRNGQLIGAIYRNHVFLVFHQSTTPIFNAPPLVSIPSNQALSTWNSDTLVFTGSPVCIQMDVTDPDTIADIRLELVQSDYNPLDISFVQNTAVIQNGDTFNTALCFTPDSFLSQVSEAKVIAIDNNCYNIKSDTLSFFFKFTGYSNAGTGGNIPIPITASLGSLSLFSYLNGNPNSGGTWLDLDNTGLLSNGQFDASGISSDVSYRFAYIDQQPNYPADTAELELNFFVVQSLLDQNDISEIKVFPNPAKNFLTISGFSESDFLELFDIHGKKVKSELLNNRNREVNISELNEGLYFYCYKNQRGKILIQR